MVPSGLAQAVSLPKYKQVVAIVRAQISNGTLSPGASAPSGAALARMTGYSVLTCRRALQTLIKDGVLAPGPSRNARPRVPSPYRHDQTLVGAQRELSVALAARRRAEGLTQPQLAQITGDSVTTIGHAETGRLWHSRAFWERVDKALDADGELLRLHDAYRAAKAPASSATASEDTDPSTDPTGALPAVEEVPIPAVILVVWSDGAITSVPMNRETLTPDAEVND